MSYLDFNKLDGGAYLGDEVNLSRAEQETPVWCWAAVIESLLMYGGGGVSQAEIVTQAFGGLIGGLPPDLLPAVLNRSYIGFTGGMWQIRSAPVLTHPTALHNAIATKQRPIALALRLPGSLHLVTCVGVTGAGAALIQDPLERGPVLPRELRDHEEPIAAYSAVVTQVRAPGS